MEVSLVIAGVIVAGLLFDFVNGFHDASNSIATIVATKVLTPRQAVLWASFFNIIAVFFFGTHVAHTVGAGMVSLDYVTPTVVLCGLLGAVVWGLTTWYLALPTSSSHALIGGYAGAVIVHHGMLNGWNDPFAPILFEGWIKVLAFIVIAPLLGMVISGVLETVLSALDRKGVLTLKDKAYRHLQLGSSALLSFMHGGNDAQKTAGIIASALTAAGFFHDFTIPFWVVALSYTTIGMGTFFGGWRIVNTMGRRVTRIKPQGGVCAEGASAMSILLATHWGLPVSTTHVTTGAILGVGVATSGGRRVRWTVVRHIFWAWFFTIPTAALMGGLANAVAKWLGAPL